MTNLEVFLKRLTVFQKIFTATKQFLVCGLTILFAGINF